MKNFTEIRQSKEKVLALRLPYLHIKIYFLFF